MKEKQKKSRILNFTSFISFSQKWEVKNHPGFMSMMWYGRRVILNFCLPVSALTSQCSFNFIIFSTSSSLPVTNIIFLKVLQYFWCDYLQTHVFPLWCIFIASEHCIVLPSPTSNWTREITELFNQHLVLPAPFGLKVKGSSITVTLKLQNHQAKQFL